MRIDSLLAVIAPGPNNSPEWLGIAIVVIVLLIVTVGVIRGTKRRRDDK